MRFFNTEGPMRADLHYLVPPLARWDLDELLMLIEQQKYFLLHAPRQTGKTTCLLALMDHLNRDGRYRAVYANIEGAQVSREDIGRGMAAICSVIGRSAQYGGGDARVEDWRRTQLDSVPAEDRLLRILEYWSTLDPRPAVLLLDEVDSLVGDTLVSLLRQLRAGYPRRPAAFPQTVILCGVRDLRDYRIHASSENAPITGGSAFNIKAESLRLGDFDETDVRALLQEHTRETGQVFNEAALARVWELTQGQPWLVNALVYRACFELPSGRDRAQPITVDLIEEAKEQMILERVTHLDQLAHKLEEPRVRRIIEPMLAGTGLTGGSDDDIRYLLDLGLVRMAPGRGLTIANPIYQEVLPRALAFRPQASLPPIHPTWLDPDGRMNPSALCAAFLAFWRQHGEPLLRSAPYHEIAPHLVLMAFLHRVTNGLGTLEREYAIGLGRMDLCLRYGAVTIGMELKVWRDGAPDPLAEGLGQLDGYLAGLTPGTHHSQAPAEKDPTGPAHATTAQAPADGWLVIFDRRTGQPPIAERTNANPMTTPSGRAITLIRA